MHDPGDPDRAAARLQDISARRAVLADEVRVRRKRVLVVTLGALAALCLAGALAWHFWEPGTQSASKPGTPGEIVGLRPDPDRLAQILDTSVMPIPVEEAKAINDQRPVDKVRVEAARPFRTQPAADNDPSYEAALRCLTQAIHYEAASESDAGQRAVAQVVLNRVRHAAFPHSVCGVVFQGSERSTGCQFSFTCDGSLLRVPSPASYARAERIARAALSGTVAAEVGHATHYHADYVVPYWAPTLDKVRTIGAHIFYQMQGSLGSARAFTMRYAPEQEVRGMAMPEPQPSTADAAIVFDPLASDGALAVPAVNPLTADIQSGSLIVGTRAQPEIAPQTSPLTADRGGGTLKIAPSRLKVDEAPELQDQSD